MKVIETHPREIGFVLWGHCQNLLDDPRMHLHLLGPKGGVVAQARKERVKEPLRG